MQRFRENKHQSREVLPQADSDGGASASVRRIEYGGESQQRSIPPQFNLPLGQLSPGNEHP